VRTQLLLSNDRDAATWAERGSAFEHGASTPGVRATTAAYRDGGPWLECRAPLADLGARPAGGRALPADVSPAEFFLAKARVMLTDGAACGEDGRGHVPRGQSLTLRVMRLVRRVAAAAVVLPLCASCRIRCLCSALT
jgi:cystathionine beta-lyase